MKATVTDLFGHFGEARQATNPKLCKIWTDFQGPKSVQQQSTHLFSKTSLFVCKLMNKGHYF